MTRTIAVAMLAVCLWYASPTRGCLPGQAWAEEADRIVRIASQDQSVLIESGAGLLRVVHVGDTVAPYGEILSIDQTRVVLRNDQAETLIISIVDGEQKVQRISKVGPSPRLILQQTVNAGKAGEAADEAGGADGRAGGVLKK